MTRRSFREQLADTKDLPRAEPLTGGMKKRSGSGTIVIPAPAEVDALMREVSRGLDVVDRERLQARLG